MARASQADRRYLERIARGNAALGGEAAPASLAEMFDRLERIRRHHGALAAPGRDSPEEGDLPSHLAFLRRLRSRGTKRP